MSTSLKTYLLILILVVLSVAGFFWWQTTQKQTSLQPSPTPAGLGSELYQKTANPAKSLPVVNPLENKPQVNPLSGANPFSGIKTNPFK